jgi:hypothetical protein
MRPFERRAAAAYPYFKLAAWDGRNLVWKAGKKTFPTEGAARAEAVKPGRYRVSRADESGYTEFEPFTVP